jgi:two-component system sensor histidine kinase UhpB
MSSGSIENYWIYWGNWAMANALGAITLGPMILVWLSPPLNIPRLRSRRTIEGIVAALILMVICAIAFHVGERMVDTAFLPAVLYSPLPIILWAAIRFGERGASGAILVVTVVAIWQNLREPALFNGIDSSTSVLGLQIFLLGIAIPVVLLGAAIDELRRSGEATRRLAGGLLRAQDEERRRIARELHDSTGQNLIVANWMTEQMRIHLPPSSEPVVSELQTTLQTAITEIRTVSYLLHPPILDGGGLSMAMRSYLEGFAKRTGIPVDFDASPNLGRMPPDIELVLFRVIQEALTNIWRHSGSQTARIQMVREVSAARDQVTLTIEDAGKGIPNAVRLATLSPGNHAPCGVGLVAMRERLLQIGGQMDIDSTAGKTIIRAIVKLNSAN